MAAHSKLPAWPWGTRHAVGLGRVLVLTGGWHAQVTSNYAEDDAWDSIRPGLQAAYLQQQPQQR